MRLFRDRAEAGRRLAGNLSGYAGRRDVVVLALPRGGVPVGFEIASALRVPLDIFLVRKLGVPGHEELAMGAIASGGVRVMNRDVVRTMAVPGEKVEEVETRERRELERRERIFRSGRPPFAVEGRTVILVDDGLATGATMRAAVKALTQREPSRVVVAVPVAARDARDFFAETVDEIVCLETPQPFLAIGAWYGDFSQLSDEEVREYLERAWETTPR